MLPRTARPLTLTTTARVVTPAPSALVGHRQRPVPPALRPETHPDLAGLDDLVGLDDLAGPDVRTGRMGACSPRSSEIVCADDATCICPLADHVTDAERAVMNDIARQASRLATVLSWIFALAALAALVLLLLR